MTSEQYQVNEVVETAVKFAAMHIAPVSMDADHGDPRFPEEVFAHGLKAGFDRFILPEAAGGFGFRMVELCALVKGVAETCAGHAMVLGVHAAAVKSLFEAGGPDSGQLLECVFAAQRPIAVSIPEPLSSDDFETALTGFLAPGKGFHLTGPGGLAFNAAASGWFLLFAKTPEGKPLALLTLPNHETFAPGHAEPALGLRAMPIQEVRLENHEAAQSNVIAESSGALLFYKSLVSNLCLVSAAAASGLMKSVSAKALRYASERYQGGKMIIDHSHLRNILGQMCAGAAASWGAVFYSATQASQDTMVLGTKVAVTESAVKACTDAVQMLGGYGYMRDFQLEKAMRDAAVLSLLPISNARAELFITALEKERLVPFLANKMSSRPEGEISLA